MSRFNLVLGFTLAATSLATVNTARGDLVLYSLPGSRFAISLQGEATFNAGGTVNFRHPKFGSLVFGLSDVEVHDVPTPKALFMRQLRNAQGAKNASQAMAAARWALRHGLIQQFYDGVNEALKIDPNFAEAKTVLQLKDKINRPLESSAEQEKQLRELVRKPDMKIKTSNHFILLHDTSDKPPKDRRRNRSDERLELLELVYESFMMMFYSRGVQLEIPRERLMVVLFNEHEDYLNYVNQLDPSLTSAAGFWDPRTNVAVFYDHGATEQFKELRSITKQLKELKDLAVRVRDKHTVRLVNTLTLLNQILQEEADITVVSHEATHQMAGNTGLLPRHVRIPSWVHEGLASYFEAPKDATWSGIGAVNEERLNWYRALEKDREHSNIDFIVGDQIFSYAGSHGAKLHGYGQAWAMTHYLMEKHFDKFMTYYRRLGEMPPDILLSPETLNRLFTDVFGEDRSAMDLEWRAYMRGLKTDTETILGDEDEDD